MRTIIHFLCCLFLVSCGQEPAAETTEVPDRTPTQESLLWEQQEAAFLKEGWIRDPFIFLHDDGYYYLTGTTPELGDARNRAEAFNAEPGNLKPALKDKKSIVGYSINVWRSTDLLDWELVGTPFSLGQGYWAQSQPELFTDPIAEDWRLWAPEMYPIAGRWAFVHTSPNPVKQGANLALTTGADMNGPFTFPLADKMKGKHDPALFQDDDGTWYLLWSNTWIVALEPDFSDFAGDPVRIDPSDRIIGHEGATLRKIGDKYVHFGTAWSTDTMRKGSYNLYYCLADAPTGPYGPRRFVGRFLGHGTPFQDRDGNWWCTAFFNANAPTLNKAGIEQRDLGETAQTINRQGTTIVPLQVDVLPDGDVFIRAKDPAYRNPGPDEATDYAKE